MPFHMTYSFADMLVYSSASVMAAIPWPRPNAFSGANNSLLNSDCPWYQCDELLHISALVHPYTFVVCPGDCRYYSKVLPPSGTKDAAILDMCSSWVSHYPKGYKLDKISGKYSASVGCLNQRLNT